MFSRTPGVAILVVLLAMAFACAIGPARGAAPEGHRIALVVGNSAYQHVPRLTNPDNDARGIAETLKSVGFVLVGGGPQLDLDKAALERAIRDFGDSLKSGDVGLFYYAGHGLQVHGVNYLVPVNANPTREADIDFELVDANLVLRQMQDANTRLNIMILDACRNNPFGGRGLSRAIATGLAQMQAPEGTIISYATQPGNVAADGSDGHSPFARAIMQAVSTRDLPVLEVFNRIGVTVKRDTGGRQQPWVSTSPIDGDFYFVAGAPSAVAAAAAMPAPPAAPAAPVPASGPDAELLFWQAIANSTNPDDYKAYLQTYPNGRFAALARVRARSPAAAAPPAAPTAVAQRQPLPVQNFAQENDDFGVPSQGWVQARLASPTPTSIPGARVTKTAELAQALRDGVGIVLIDVLNAWHQTIPGAIRLPAAGQAGTLGDQIEQALAVQLRLIVNRKPGAQLVFFCQGAQCWESYNAVLRAVHLGYRNVVWYRGGLASWSAAGLPTVW